MTEKSPGALPAITSGDARDYFERWALTANPDERTNWQVWSAAWTCAMSQPQPKGAQEPYGFESGLVQMLNEARCLSEETVGNRELAGRVMTYIRMHWDAVVQAPAPAPVPAENLPTKEHIRELAQEALDQIMEQAQVFASAWSLIGGRFDYGNALSEAHDAKDELRTMVRSLADLAAEMVRPVPCAAVGASRPSDDTHIDNFPSPRELLQSIVECSSNPGERDFAASMLAEAANREAFSAGYEAAQQDAERCDLPPLGWRCTRKAGHEGPCAAVEAPEDVEFVDKGMARLREAKPPVQGSQS